jgi:DNA-binding MarR family transcriptional regulator
VSNLVFLNAEIAGITAARSGLSLREAGVLQLLMTRLHGEKSSMLIGLLRTNSQGMSAILNKLNKMQYIEYSWGKPPSEKYAKITKKGESVIKEIERTYMELEY